MYAKTYFSLVSETHYFDDGEEHVFFSEKLFKLLCSNILILIASRVSIWPNQFRLQDASMD